MYSNLDYFLYETGAATARPPSLSMLPACYIPLQYECLHGDDTRRREHRNRKLQEKDTVVLRRGDGDLLVAQLEVSHGDVRRKINAELCVIGAGRSDSELIETVPITFHGEVAASGGKGGAELMQQWETEAAIPVGDRFMCFVDYLRGMLLCDTMAMESHRRPLSPLCDTRCCHGGSIQTLSCVHGCFAFTLTMWSLSLTTVDDEELSLATWIKDGVLDCEEVCLEYPIVSSDNPDVVCFTVCGDPYASNRDMNVRMVELNLRSKELVTVIPSTTDCWRSRSHVAQNFGGNLLFTCFLEDI